MVQGAMTVGRTTLYIKTLSIKGLAHNRTTLHIKTLSITRHSTLSIKGLNEAFSITTLSRMTLYLMTFSIVKVNEVLSITTLYIMLLSIVRVNEALSIMTFYIMTLSIKHSNEVLSIKTLSIMCFIAKLSINNPHL
jgi:hypothetical protein